MSKFNKKTKRIRNLPAFVGAYLRHRDPSRDTAMAAAFRKALTR